MLLGYASGKISAASGDETRPNERIASENYLRRFLPFLFNIFPRGIWASGELRKMVKRIKDFEDGALRR